MPPQNHQNNNHTSTIKVLILETALDLFTTKGYFNTSVHHIQKTAGVSIGSIYHYFKNKEAIAKELYDDLTKQMSQAISNIMQTHQSTRQRCRTVIQHLFELTETSPAIMNYMLYANHREFIAECKPICSSTPFEMITRMIQSGIDNGEIRPMDPITASVSLFGGALRLIHLKLDYALPHSLNYYFDDVWQNACQGVGLS